MERFSCRLVTIFSTVTMMSGSLLIYFSSNFNQLIIACVLIGYAACLANFSSYYILDMYFQRHFTLVFSIRTLIRGIGSTLATPINQFIVMRYGWKSSYLILTAVFYQMTVCATVFRTPKKAQKHEQNDKEMQFIELNPPKKKKTWLKERLDYLHQLGHFSLFNKSTFLLLLFALFLQGTVNEGILLIMTDDLKDRGATLHASQFIGTFYGLGNLIGAPFHYVCSNFISKNFLVHYALCLFTASLSFFVCIAFKNAEFVLYITIFVYGFSNGWETTLKPLIIKYHIDYDDFAFGLAWVNFSYGISAFVGSHIIGKSFKNYFFFCFYIKI
ncbi:monocarboxylate transporter 2-like isoform X2 [Anneissia japonica]|nr:monocarboxylate transporter 2-like isoform X2 [Anneissia japonica]XP_033122710.1 monocarboxylate transporter 2-like isoform X2 [Anneissia japonica]